MFKLILYTSALLILILIGYTIYPAFHGAYLSTKLACNQQFYEDNKQLIVGYVTTNNTDTSNNTLQIVTLNNDKITYKHELCHKVQYDDNRLFDCGAFNLPRFANEFECYISQSFPDRLYEKVYTEIPEN